MRRRRRGDDYAIYTGGEQFIDRIGRCGTVFRGDSGDKFWPLVGDHQPVDAVQAAEDVGVEGADAAQPDHAECRHGILLRVFCAGRT